MCSSNTLHEPNNWMEITSDTPDSERDFLRRAAALLGVTLTDTQIDQLLRFRSLLLDWNTRINLTAITDPHAVLTRHILDSLTCLLACDQSPQNQPVHLLDVGSGAGFPGLALAIAQPEWHVTSLEATGKKVRFQQAIIDDLHLPNVRVVQGRAEEMAHDPAWRGKFNVVTARALAALPVLLEWCQPFAARGGMVLALKKGDLAAEIAQGNRAAQILGSEPVERIALPSALTAVAPDLAGDRAILRVRQRTHAPALYPRSSAATAKKPLGSGPTPGTGPPG